MADKCTAGKIDQDRNQNQYRIFFFTPKIEDQTAHKQQNILQGYTAPCEITKQQDNR
jgi:hypothetical protein